MKFILLLLCFILSLQFSAKAEQRPNIIVILTDDQRWDYLGCAGHPYLKTPHLDQLAKEGTYFPKAFVTSSSCCPSRTSILTGQYERKHGVTFGSMSSLKAEAFSQTYPMLLKQAGYYTGYVGKNHTPVGAMDPAFAQKAGLLPKKIKDPHTLAYLSGHLESQFDYWFGNHGHIGFYPKKPPYDRAKPHTQPEILAEGALNFLRQNPSLAGTASFLQQKPNDKPFCLLVNFNVPHTFSINQMAQRPKDPELYRSTYREFTEYLALPQTYLAAQEITTTKLPLHVYNGQYLSGYNFVKNKNSLREQMVRTCQTVSGIDNLVGKLIAELKAQNLYQNTIIIMTSDHGLQFGEHGLGGKCLLYEASIRVPLIIRDPRAKEHAGLRPQKMALNIDLAPTILDLTGLRPYPEMQGHSLRPLIYNTPIKDWRSDFFAENLFMGQNYPRIEAVRNVRYKYLRYFDKKKDKAHQHALTASIRGEEPIYEELYDLKNDPLEKNNLANASNVKQTLSFFQKRCQTLVKEAKGDNQEYPMTHQF